MRYLLLILLIVPMISISAQTSEQHSFYPENGEDSMFYKESGQGDTILLMIHGLGSNSESFSKLQEISADHFKSVVIDLPGYRESPKGDLHPGMQNYAQLLIEFIEGKKYKNVILVGHSMGGQIAMTMAQHSANMPWLKGLFLLAPAGLETFNEQGDFLIKVKKQDMIHEYIYAAHPFSVVGWDGYNFPYKFSIHDFEPITGRVHMPPPIHQTFESAGFVICSFVPRLYDYHPNAVPAPYNHSNIDSDEVLYYVDGDFMSRNNIEIGQITLHPAGIPHGPHPGAMERSIGKKSTEELAVMVDTFKPLMVTEEALKLADDDYYKSWLNH